MAKTEHIYVRFQDIKSESFFDLIEKKKVSVLIIATAVISYIAFWIMAQ